MTVTRKRSQIGKAQRAKPWGVPMPNGVAHWQLPKRRMKPNREPHYLLGDEEIDGKDAA